MIAEKEQEIAVLKTSLSSAIQSQHEAQRLLVSTRSELEKELQQQYSSATEKVEEELQQLRKDNADMAARIELLMNEVGLPAFNVVNCVLYQSRVKALHRNLLLRKL